jgi:hypothetical protein
MLFGRANLVDEPAEKARQLELFVERMYPGRWQELRPVTAQEIKATTVLAMHIEEGSAKIRSGPPKDDAEDLDWPVWAGVVPTHLTADALQREPGQRSPAGEPAYARDLKHIGIR